MRRACTLPAFALNGRLASLSIAHRSGLLMHRLCCICPGTKPHWPRNARLGLTGSLCLLVEALPQQERQLLATGKSSSPSLTCQMHCAEARPTTTCHDISLYGHKQTCQTCHRLVDCEIIGWAACVAAHTPVKHTHRLLISRTRTARGGPGTDIDGAAAASFRAAAHVLQTESLQCLLAYWHDLDVACLPVF